MPSRHLRTQVRRQSLRKSGRIGPRAPSMPETGTRQKATGPINPRDNVEDHAVHAHAAARVGSPPSLCAPAHAPMGLPGGPPGPDAAQVK